MGRDISEGIGGALKGNGVNGVSYMLYVDDLTTYDPVGLAGQMQIMLNRLRAYAVRKGLTLNTPELVMHLNNGSRSRSSLTTFKYRNVALPQKGQFEYLGTLAYKQRKKATQAVKTLPTSNKGERVPRAKAPCIPSTKNKKKPMGIRRATSNSPCLILVMRVEISLLESASSANKHMNLKEFEENAEQPYMVAQQRLRKFLLEHDLRNRPHALDESCWSAHVTARCPWLSVAYSGNENTFKQKTLSGSEGFEVETAGSLKGSGCPRSREMNKKAVTIIGVENH
eukprot:1148812-Pelagomonas_calceolata.AAC.9